MGGKFRLLTYIYMYFLFLTSRFYKIFFTGRQHGSFLLKNKAKKILKACNFISAIKGQGTKKERRFRRSFSIKNAIVYLNCGASSWASFVILARPSSGRLPFLNSARMSACFSSICCRNISSKARMFFTGTSRIRLLVPR